MGLYSKAIRKKEEDNQKYEQYADESLLNDKAMLKLEEGVDDAQTTVLYILGKFGIQMDRLYGLRNVDEMLEMMLDPLGMMYDYAESVETFSGARTEYILAFREDGKAVALTPTMIGYRYFCPHDASVGYASKKYCRSLKKGCYVFQRPLDEREGFHATFHRNVLKSLTFTDIFRLMLAAALVAGLGLILPIISRWVYKTYIPKGEGNVSALLTMMLVFLLVSVIRGFLSMVKTLLLSETKIRISRKMQSAVMARVLHLNRDFFEKTSSGKLSKRINSCGRLSDMILGFYMDVLLDVLFSVVYLFQMNNMAPDLFLPALIFLILKILVSIISATNNMTNEKELLEVEMENSGFMYAAIRGIQRIKGMGCENAVYAKWAGMYRKILARAYQQPFFLKYNTEIIAAISTAATITLLGTSIYEGISSEDYLSFVASYALVISTVASLTDMLDNAFLMKTLYDNASPIFHAITEQHGTKEYVRKLTGEIDLENVKFSYENDPKGCIKGISLKIHKGEKLAIVGESGCGKSTMLKLMLGMETPQEGTISYDGKPIQTLNLKSLRKRIGSVFQFSKVFPGTIASNVVFGAGRKVSDEEIWDAVDKAAIGDYIRTLPMKLDTEISESNSSGFSGGQRQRLLIARALIKKPRVLILDEATSALDNLTQAQVLESISHLNCTIIMVAHRLSTVTGFDRIVMLEDGVIAEEGSYSELMEKNGRFARLVSKQQVKRK
ncbi:MAG: ATP-binding cassette domain-containing protein [Eubacterium sp.]|nr:ATP-binding cassette domain-containing protein [Eubacterium sp.]